jgi:hypothetical protein
VHFGGLAPMDSNGRMKFWLATLVSLTGCVSHSTSVVGFDYGERHVPITHVTIAFDSKSAPMKKYLGIDTGSAHTILFATPDEVLDLPESAHDYVLAGDGNLVDVYRLPHAKMGIGKFTIDTPVMLSPREAGPDAGMDGVIGNDLLSRYDLRFDFQAKTMTLVER